MHEDFPVASQQTMKDRLETSLHDPSLILFHPFPGCANPALVTDFARYVSGSLFWNWPLATVCAVSSFSLGMPRKRGNVWAERHSTHLMTASLRSLLQAETWQDWLGLSLLLLDMDPF